MKRIRVRKDMFALDSHASRSSLRTVKRSVFTLVLVVAALLGSALPGAALGQSAVGGVQATSPQFRTLLVTARQQGSVRVIVRLNTAFQPEGNLSNGQAIVDQREGIARAQQAVLNRLANRNIHGIKRMRYTPFVAMAADANALDALKNDPDVVSIEEDGLATPGLAQSVPLIGGSSTGTFGSGAYTGSGQTVAVLDTGVKKDHTFLTNKVVSEGCYSTTDSTQGSTAVCTDGSTASGSGVNCSTAVSGCDHGTHVAGIVAGNGTSFRGVARNANLIAMQVFSRFTGASCGTGPDPCVLSYTSDQMQALERVYALRTTYSIPSINMSLGGGKFTSNCDTDSRKPIIDTLRAAGIATIIASGNSSFVDGVGAPSCISTAITVGSSTKSNAISWFSNMDDTVELMAPGGDGGETANGGINSSITTSTSAFGQKSGTSMATPHVAGAWAVMRQAKPAATVTEILTALQNTGVNIVDNRVGGTQTKKRIALTTAVNQLVAPPPAACADTFEADNTAAQAKSLPLNTAQLHRICAANDQDWVRFSVTANTTYRLYTYSLYYLNDTKVTVYSNAGTTVATENDDDYSLNGTYASSVLFTPTVSGTWYAKIVNPNNKGSSAYYYSLKLITVADACNSYESDNTARTAKYYPLGTVQLRATCTPGDQDWVYFRIVKGSPIVRIETFDLGTSATNAMDTYLELYQNDGTTLIESDDDDGPGFGSRIELSLGVGNYRLKVRDFNSSSGDVAQRYTLRISRLDPTPSTNSALELKSEK